MTDFGPKLNPLRISESNSFHIIQDQLAEERFSLEQCGHEDDAYFRGRVEALEQLLLHYESFPMTEFGPEIAVDGKWPEWLILVSKGVC